MTDNRDQFLDTFMRRALGTYNYLNQGEHWYPEPPAEPVHIADMEPEWRYNCARMLLRNAAALADRYSWGEVQTPTLFGLSDDNAFDLACDMERWHIARLADPQGWIRTTRLYRVLVAGLPGKPQKLYRLAQRARHWGDCAARRSNAAPCTCSPTRRNLAAPVLVTGAPANNRTGGRA